MLVISTALYLTVLGNFRFFNILLADYPFSKQNAAFLFSVGMVTFCLLTLLLSILNFRRVTKPLLILVLLISAVISYFQDEFGIVFDSVLIECILETNISEALDLFCLDLLYHVLITGVLPAFIVYQLVIKPVNLRQALMTKLSLISCSFLLVVITLLAFSADYASFFREHKDIRSYSNPIMFFYSAGKFVATSFNNNEQATFQEFDAKMVAGTGKPPLVVLVVGETARAGNFSLNGYGRTTTPYLQQRRDIVSFKSVTSCGTATAVSIPCMFSSLDQSEFESNKAASRENLLDLLRRAGVDVLWRDNNSDSKDVALRIPYEDYTTDDTNPLCDIECRDEGMLDHLQSYVDNLGDRPALIVLHQMGSHGPAYYKRYPGNFEIFTPACATNELAACSNIEITNAYDNTIVYTDYFLNKVISFLEMNSQHHRTAMIYVGDHGESLGEFGIYLHGLPWSFAPKEQIHIPMITWFGEGYEEEAISMMRNSNVHYSHDNLFHTMLDLFHVRTSLFQRSKSMLRTEA